MAVDESEVETGHHVGWKVTVVALPPNYAEAQYGAQSHPRTKHDVNAEAEIARGIDGGGATCIARMIAKQVRLGV